MMRCSPHIICTLVDVQGFFDEYVGASLLWMKINVVPIVSVEDAALVQASVVHASQWMDSVILHHVLQTPSDVSPLTSRCCYT